MAEYPPLIDFLIDLNEPSSHDYWNYYAFDSSIINSLDFSYLKILQNQGFYTEILLKQPFSDTDGPDVFLSMTEERIPFNEKRKKRRLKKKIEIAKTRKKTKNEKMLSKIEKNNKTPINFKLIRKKSKYSRQSRLKKQQKNQGKSPEYHQIMVKIEDTTYRNPMKTFKNNEQGQFSFPFNNHLAVNGFKSMNGLPNEQNFPKYLHNGRHFEQTMFYPEMFARNTIHVKNEENALLPIPTPTFTNFVEFLKSEIKLNPEDGRFSEGDANSLYLIRTLIDIQDQPERIPEAERGKNLLRLLPATPKEPLFLPAFNHALEIDYNLLHLTIQTDVIAIENRVSGFTLPRIVSFHEEKSLRSLSNHFRIPRMELNGLFNCVSRYIPDLMEVFKGNNKLIWSDEEDFLLKNGKNLIKDNDRKRTLRRIKFLSAIGKTF